MIKKIFYSLTIILISSLIYIYIDILNHKININENKVIQGLGCDIS